MQYLLFNTLAAFNLWHNTIKVQKMLPFKGTTDYTAPLCHPDILDKRVICMFKNDIDLTGLTIISEEQARVYGWFNEAEIAAKNYIAKRVTAAQEFGLEIIKDFAIENIYLGLTIADTAYVSSRLENIQQLLNSGSLYTALIELESMQPEPPLIPQDRITRFAYKIRKFLGLPI